MGQIEEIKEILTEVRSTKGKYHSPEISNEEIAKVICDTLIPQGDDEGLLTDKEIIEIGNKYFKEVLGEEIAKEHYHLGLAKLMNQAQRDLTRQEKDRPKYKRIVGSGRSKGRGEKLTASKE